MSNISSALNFLPCPFEVSGWIEHYDSAIESIPSGSWLALQEVPKPYSFLWGQRYVIKYNGLTLTRRIGRSDTDAIVKGHAEDTNHETIDIPVSKIQELYLVVGSMSRFH